MRTKFTLEIPGASTRASARHAGPGFARDTSTVTRRLAGVDASFTRAGGLAVQHKADAELIVIDAELARRTRCNCAARQAEASLYY